MMMWVTQMEVFLRVERYAPQDLIRFLRHQLRIKMRTDRKRLTATDFNRRWVRVARLVHVNRAKLFFFFFYSPKVTTELLPVGPHTSRSQCFFVVHGLVPASFFFRVLVKFPNHSIFLSSLFILIGPALYISLTPIDVSFPTPLASDFLDSYLSAEYSGHSNYVLGFNTVSCLPECFC